MLMAPWWHNLEHAGMASHPPYTSYITMTCRVDGARALELAASKGFARVGYTLMCHGALAVPDWLRRGEPRCPDGTHIPFTALPKTQVATASEMLVCDAVRCADAPW